VAGVAHARRHSSNWSRRVARPAVAHGSAGGKPDAFVVFNNLEDVMTIETRVVGTVVVLDLSGSLDITNESRLRDKMHSLVFEGRRAFVINMDRVTHIDSSGLGALIASSGTVAKVAGRIALVNLTRRVSEVMTITKLLTVFDVPDSETMAVVQLSSPPITH